MFLLDFYPHFDIKSTKGEAVASADADAEEVEVVNV